MVINLKRIAISVITMVMALTVGAYATTAAWTDSVTVTSNIIRTGSADLQVSTKTDGAGVLTYVWSTTSRNSEFDVSGLVPDGDFANEYSYSLRSVGDIGFSLKGQITAITYSKGEPVGLNNMRMRVYEHGTDNPVSDEYGLAQWINSPRSLGEIGFGGDIRDYDIRVWLNGSADNTWQGQVIDFTLDVSGTSVAP